MEIFTHLHNITDKLNYGPQSLLLSSLIIMLIITVPMKLLEVTIKLWRFINYITGIIIIILFLFFKTQDKYIKYYSRI